MGQVHDGSLLILALHMCTQLKVPIKIVGVASSIQQHLLKTAHIVAQLTRLTVKVLRLHLVLHHDRDQSNGGSMFV